MERATRPYSSPLLRREGFESKTPEYEDRIRGNTAGSPMYLSAVVYGLIIVRA